MERTDAKQRNQSSGASSTSSFGQALSTSNVVTLKQSTVPVITSVVTSGVTSRNSPPAPFGSGSMFFGQSPSASSVTSSVPTQKPESQIPSGNSSLPLPGYSAASGSSPPPVAASVAVAAGVIGSKVASGVVVTTVSSAAGVPVSETPVKVALEDQSIHSVNQNVIPFIGPVAPPSNLPLSSGSNGADPPPPPVGGVTVPPGTPSRNGSPPNSLENTPTTSDGDPMDL